MIPPTASPISSTSTATPPEVIAQSWRSSSLDAMQFFIPHLREDPEVAEVEWKRYLRDSGAPAASRRVHSVTYMHDGSRYEVSVGEPRRQYARKRGPRGGYIKNAELSTYGNQTGTVVSGIVDAGDVLHVWSYGPPFGGWANPSMVGRAEIHDISYFGESD